MQMRTHTVKSSGLVLFLRFDREKLPKLMRGARCITAHPNARYRLGQTVKRHRGGGGVRGGYCTRVCLHEGGKVDCFV